jgi:Tol biopolymer transport system component
MDDLRKRFRTLDDVEAPDVWDLASSRPTTTPVEPFPSLRRRLVVIAAALAMAAGAVFLVIRAFRPAPVGVPPAATVSNGDIWAFAGGGDGASSVYAINPETGTDRLLWTDFLDVVGSPADVDPARVANDYAFSPDGSRVAFSHFLPDSERHVEIFIMNADGSGLLQLTHDDAFAGFPSWSPDGTTIAYSSFRGDAYIPGCLGTTLCPSDLYTIGVDGSDHRRLTEDDTDESMPNWSPDGRRIAFKGETPSGGAIEVADSDGRNRSRIFEELGNNILRTPAWSPDGSQIVFLYSGERLVDVWVVHPDGSGAHRLLQTRMDTNAGPPVWSPDGQMFAYTELGGIDVELWIARSDGSNAHRVANGVFPIAWQPA